MTPTPKYPGEPWFQQQAREVLADRDRQTQAMQPSPSPRKRPRKASPRPADAPKAPATPQPQTPPPARRWARHGGDHPNDYRLTPEENNQ